MTLAESRSTSMASVGFAIVFFLFWSVMTLGVDCLTGWTLIQQIRSYQHAVTTGVIAGGGLEDKSDSDGESYRPTIRYSYVVGGQSYSSDQIHYGAHSGSKKWAKSRLDAYPPGAEVPVYYRPGNPNDAVLEIGVTGIALFLPMFLLPFNGVMLLGWSMGLKKFRSRETSSEASGVPIVADGSTLRARPMTHGPITAAVAVMAAAGFGLTFIIAFCTSMDPSLNTMIGVWIAILAVALFVYVWTSWSIRTGRHDLVIEPFARRLTLPARVGRLSSLTVDFNDVLTVEVREKVTTNDGETTRTYPVTLLYKDAAGLKPATFATLPTREQADGFSQWLREQLGLSRRSQPRDLKGDELTEITQTYAD